MPPSLKDLSVLVVENEFLLAINLEATMRDAGASKVEMAASLADAERLVEESTFDAAILDIRLMDGDSLPLAQRLIKKGVPVVIHSGHANHAHTALVPEAVFLPKPSTPTEIVRSVLRARGVGGAFDLPEVAIKESAQ
ncbi:MAG: response regulator [Pseudomonadota bacterium]